MNSLLDPVTITREFIRIRQAAACYVRHNFSYMTLAEAATECLREMEKSGYSPEEAELIVSKALKTLKA